MAVNLDKPHLWKQDTQASVNYYNRWLMKFAPKAFRATRIQTTKSIERAIVESNDMRDVSPGLLLSRPGILPALRMSCCPPLAVDRLVGLAYTNKNLVKNMEEGKLSVRMSKRTMTPHLTRIVKVIGKLLDPDIFVWISERKRRPKRKDIERQPLSPTGLQGPLPTRLSGMPRKNVNLAKLRHTWSKEGTFRRLIPPVLL